MSIPGFFNSARAEIFGQDADVLPVPRFVRRRVLPMLANEAIGRIQRRLGAFVFVSAQQPLLD